MVRRAYHSPSKIIDKQILYHVIFIMIVIVRRADVQQDSLDVYHRKGRR